MLHSRQNARINEHISLLLKRDSMLKALYAAASQKAAGQENVNIFRARSPAQRKSSEKPSTRHSMHLDVSGASQLAKSRLNEGSGTSSPGSVASPLKRNDVSMNVDQDAGYVTHCCTLPQLKYLQAICSWLGMGARFRL